MPSVKELRTKAKELGVPKYSKLSKEQLIWAVQEAEGHVACFHRIPDCGIVECWFREECLPTS